MKPHCRICCSMHCWALCPDSWLSCAADIVKYLFKEYGAGKEPSPGLLERYPSKTHISVRQFFSHFTFLVYLLNCRLGMVGDFLSSTLVTGWVPTLVRAGRGMTLFQRAPIEPPEKLLELYSYENNQVCSQYSSFSPWWFFFWTFRISEFNHMWYYLVKCII